MATLPRRAAGLICPLLVFHPTLQSPHQI
ncbi:hypothetical protein V12B01_13650 [Vibrio splendidus 12B01]|nr:hypothetical protein V12B01_13650 [Vibrio splendidus 12B01]